MNRELDETRLLVSQAHAGAREAFDTLFRTHRLELERQLPRGRARRFDRSDVIQETMLDAVRAFERFVPRAPGSFRAWLARIAHNRVRALLRDERRLRRDVGREWRAASSSFEPSAPTRSPSERAAAHDERERLARALARLPDDQACVIRLVKFDELALAAVALRMQRSENAVKKLLARSLLALRAELEREERA